MRNNINNLTTKLALDDTHDHHIKAGAHHSDILMRFEKNNNRDLTDFLLEKGTISQEERNSIVQMIDSSDDENYTVAKEILKTMLCRIKT